MTRTSAVLALLLLLPIPSHAQARQPQSASSNTNQVAIRGFGDAGVTVFTASQSFTAVLGRRLGPVFGGGVELDLPRHLFVSVAATRFRRSGQRVFVFQGQVFDLNVPTTITVTPLELTAGYRFTGLGSIVPYAGAGGGWHKYDETSALSSDSDDVHQTFKGYQVLGGAEVRAGKWFAAAAEAQWASVPDALGKGPTSVSTVYNERNLGGFTFRLKLLVGR